MDRRQFLIAATIGGAAAGALGWNFFRSPLIPEVPALEQIVEQAAKSSEISKDALRQALALLENPNYHNVAIGKNGNIGLRNLSYSDEYLKKLENVLVCRADSHFMDGFYRQMSDAQAKAVKDNVKYIIFTRNVYRDLGFMKEEVHGLSLGNGAILIDPSTDPDLLPGNIRHEASHESDKGVALLDSEYHANDAKIRVLLHQVNSINGDDFENQWKRSKLSGAIAGTREEQATASYLRRFDGTFNNVYPVNVILSRDLLAAKIDATFLRQIADSTKGKEDIDEEMHYAAKSSHVALTLSREQAIERLYMILKDPHATNIERMNSIFALGYLSSNALKLMSFPGHQPRGIRVSLNGAFPLDLGYYEGDLMPDPEWKMRWEAHERWVESQERKPIPKGRMRAYSLPTRTSRFITYGNVPLIAALMENKAYENNFLNHYFYKQ